MEKFHGAQSVDASTNFMALFNACHSITNHFQILKSHLPEFDESCDLFREDRSPVAINRVLQTSLDIYTALENARTTYESLRASRPWLLHGGVYPSTQGTYSEEMFRETELASIAVMRQFLKDSEDKVKAMKVLMAKRIRELEGLRDGPGSLHNHMLLVQGGPMEAHDTTILLILLLL